MLNELQDVSDDALLELVARILSHEEDAIAEAIDSLAVVTKVAHNVAERLLTGRRAEEFFLAHSANLWSCVGSVDGEGFILAGMEVRRRTFRNHWATRRRLYCERRAE